MHGIGLWLPELIAPTIRVKDLAEAGYLDFDLEDLLDLLGNPASNSIWKCQVDEVTSKDLPVNLVTAFNSSEHDGRTLMRLAAITRQVIDGKFEGRDCHSQTPWICLTAVDSSYWEVWASNESCFEPLKKRFSHIENDDDF